MLREGHQDSHSADDPGKALSEGRRGGSHEALSGPALQATMPRGEEEKQSAHQGQAGQGWPEGRGLWWRVLEQ